ncbi:TonB-dependent receptor [Flammeovirga aprica]|uniref:TonB-dependent receptor n=1 Tax=Flammeovirga aprica JL-4 TaxID=694437 RepID=A0A7X9X9K2_9BACT|nr:TonB-dependent receptor [Flammeovirga aprica]NME68863.1 TonB-dependent receptor [Flammeovirga aprica JL-4]
MIRRILLSIYILFLSVTLLSAQERAHVAGKVIDAHTKKGIPFCTVQLKDLKKGGYTDADGTFKLPKVLVGAHELVVTRTGYSPFTKNINLTENGILNMVISLKESEVELDAVMVIGESEETKMEKQGFASKKIDTEKVAIQSVELNTLLDQTSGINVRQEGGLGSRTKYSINGLSGNAVRIFIDGVPMEYYGASYSINSLPVNLIESMEVYKGVVPVTLGSDALGGAINIKTKNAKKNSLDFSYSMGSFNTHQVALNGSHRNKKNGFTFRGSMFYNYADNDYEVWGKDVTVADPNTGRVSEVRAKRFNDGYEAYGTKVDVGFTDVKWADQFFISMVYSDMYKEVQHGATMNVPFGERHYTQGNLVPSISYQKKDLFTKGLDVSLFSSYAMNSRTLVDTTKNKYNWHGDVVGENPAGGETGSPIHSTTDEGTLINRFNVSYALNDNNVFNMSGIVTDYRRTGFNRTAQLGEDTSNDYQNIFKSVIGLSYSNTALDGKLRTNVFAKQYSYTVDALYHTYSGGEYHPLPKESSDTNYGYGIASSYDLTEKFTVQLSAEQAVRLPMPDELFGNGAENGISNLELKPEISKNLNLGFRYGEVYMGDHALTFSTTLFYRNVEDMIQRSVDNRGDYFFYENHPKIISKGIDLQIDYDYNRKLFFTFSGSYNDTRYNNEFTAKGEKDHLYQARLKNAPYLQFNTNMRYDMTELIKSKGQLQVYWNMRYVHKYYRYWEHIGSDNKDHIPTQFVNDIGASYRFPQNKLAVSLDIKNVFNEQVFDNFAIQQPGRGFYFKVSYSIF